MFNEFYGSLSFILFVLTFALAICTIILSCYATYSVIENKKQSKEQLPLTALILLFSILANLTSEMGNYLAKIYFGRQ